MENQSNIVIKIENKLKDSFYKSCYSLNITPMRAILILIERFNTGNINAMPIVEDYKSFKEKDREDKLFRLLKYRIDGKEAYEINSKRKIDETKAVQ